MSIVEAGDNPNAKKRQHSSPEMRIQADCVKWLWNEHPETRGLFFHVPNEIDRPDANAMIGARRRAEGVIRGVADMILLIQRHGYGALCVEFKTEVGRQSDYQVAWQKLVEAQGYRYVVCRSLEQFKSIIQEYLVPLHHV